MPRFRLPARYVRACSASLAFESCASCASALAATATGSSSPALPASCVNPSPQSVLWRSISTSSALSGQKEEEKGYGRLCGISSYTRDVDKDLFLCLKKKEQAWVLDQRLSLSARHGWALQSLTVAYSTERARHDDQEDKRLKVSELGSRSLQKREGEDEDTVVVKPEGFYSTKDGTLAASAGDSRRSATFWQGDGDESTHPYSGLASTDEDESDLSDRELVDVEESDCQSEDLNVDVQLESEHGRREDDGEDSRWADLRLEDLPQEAAAEMEDVDSSQLLSNSSNEVPASTEDAGEMWLRESELDGDQHHYGFPYLHILSVEEIQEILEKTRAMDVRILQVRKCCEWVDQLVFASGRSSRHLRGMADAIVYKVKQRSANVGPNSFPIVEGRDGEQWMAIDCGNIVVHLFLEEARNYYNLEEFWTKKSAPRLVETY